MGQNKKLLVILVAIWLTSVAGGMSAVISYSNAPGAVGKPPSVWPVDCTIQRAHDHHTLLMFMHPRCPCSRASVNELARLLSQTGDILEAYVFLFQPVDESDNWSHTDLWEAATRIPGVNVRSDVGAATASQFAAKASGQVLLYDTEGRLQFSGGITAGRGHEGDNTGRSSIVSLVRGNGQPPNTCPVFGCPIVE